MQPAMTCAVHILAYTISNFVVLSLMIRKAKHIRIFVLMYTNLLFCFQIRLLCYRFGCPATDLAAVPQIWPTWLKFTYYATDLATVPHNWPPCHLYGRHATDMPAVSQIWLLQFQTKIACYMNLIIYNLILSF